MSTHLPQLFCTENVILTRETFGSSRRLSSSIEARERGFLEEEKEFVLVSC